MLDTAVFNQAYYVEIMGEKQRLDDESKTREIARWNENRTSYVATKIIPGYGTLLYMAVTSKPDEGWTERGYRDYKF